MTVALVCPDGHSILLFCKGIIRALKRIPEARVLVICDAGRYHDEIEALGVTTISVPMVRFVDPRRDFLYVLRLHRIFRRERCDAVLNFSTKPNVYGTIAARIAGVELVLSHVVGLGATFLEPTDRASRWLRRLMKTLYRLACAWSDKVWFTNENDLRFFLDNGLVTKDKTVLTRNYLDVEAYAPEVISVEEAEATRRELGLVKTDRVVLMVARMIWPKGVREFAEAAVLLRARHPELKFLLVAPLETGSRDAVPESFVRDMEQRGNFRWLGFQESVKRLYAICDMAVLPSYYKEGGYPRALLEPMAMGKPVITTNSPDCCGAVDDGHNGYLVPVRDSTALAEAISRLASNAGTRAAFGKSSRVKTEREFDERKIVVGALQELGLPISC